MFTDSRMPTNFESEDARDLEQAVRRLEYTSFAMRIATAIGKPIEYGIKRLPDGGRALIQRAARTAIEKCLDVALTTLGKRTTPASATFHKVATGVTGAVGGFFGFLALAIELPVSTAVMLRSIAEIAREEGENLADPVVRLACIEVFAFGGHSKGGDPGDTGYYAVRATLARALQEAAAFISERGLAESGAPAVVRFVTQIASRFGITISEKAAAQSVPVIGAVAGGTINVVFTDHFQQVARGHFTVRRLERKYGEAAVRAEYERVKARLKG
jgi:EcsC protein family